MPPPPILTTITPTRIAREIGCRPTHGSARARARRNAKQNNNNNNNNNTTDDYGENPSGQIAENGRPTGSRQKRQRVTTAPGPRRQRFIARPENSPSRPLMAKINTALSLPMGGGGWEARTFWFRFRTVRRVFISDDKQQQ